MSVKGITDLMGEIGLQMSSAGAYLIVDRLRERGMLLESARPPMPVRGGRETKLYRTTKKGRDEAVAALRRLTAVMESIGT